MGLNVEQLLAILAKMPRSAVVLLEGDNGLSMVAGANLEHNENGLPDEVILFPDNNE